MHQWVGTQRLATRTGRHRACWLRAIVVAGLAFALVLALTWVAGSAGPPGDIGHLHALAVDPVDGSLWIGTHHRLFRSPDDGKTWQAMKLPAGLAAMDFMAFAMDPADGKTMYVGTHNKGILKTADRGETWTQVKGIGGVDVHALAVDAFAPAQPKRWYAWVVDKGLFRSLGDLDEWKRQDDGPPNPDVRVLQSVNIATEMGGIWLYAGTADGLYRSPDCF